MRGSFLALLGTVSVAAAACSVYDSSLLVQQASGTGGGGSTGSGGSAGSTTDGGGGTATGGAGAGGTSTGGGGSGGAAGCDHVSYPPPPTSVITPGGNIEIVGVQYDVDLGDSPPDPNNPPTRFRNVGFDLDNICTSDPKNLRKGQSCVIPTFGTGVLDGPGGQDNALGTNIQFIRDRLSDFTSEAYSNSLKAGTAASVALHITGYNGEPNDDQIRLEAMVTSKFDDLSPTKGITPKWDGTDVWPIASDSVLGGRRDKPKFFDNNAYVTNGKVVASLSDAGLRLIVALTTVAKVNLNLALHAAFTVCDISKTTVGRWGWQITNCTLAGRWLADDIIHQLSHFPDPLALPNVRPLCTSSASYNVFKQGVCQVSDVTSNLASPNTVCDSLSMGVQYNTKPALLGDVFTVNSVGELCPPGQEPSQDCCNSIQPDGTTDPTACGSGTGGTGGTGGTTGAGGTTGTGGTATDGGADASIKDAGTKG